MGLNCYLRLSTSTNYSPERDARIGLAVRWGEASLLVPSLPSTTLSKPTPVQFLLKGGAPVI